jgi:alginate O-acetyltransferase complex protein AlgI
MLFNTFQFAIFLTLIIVLHRNLPYRARNPLLLGASLVFYTLWVPAYLLLLLFDLLVNYSLLHAMARSAHPRRYLAIIIAFTLGLLGYFKYAAMIVASMLAVVPSALADSVEIPSVLLPLGISFYSFQIIAYAVDQYREPDPDLPSLARYSLFISFFPQLIAGPILRGRELLPQLQRIGTPTPERTRRGLWLLASGIAKKVIIADFLLAPYVDNLFANPGVASGPFHLVGAYSFAFQIYFDFSGYTDMGRGMALLLGFELPFNFREPYLSRNPAEFWRRWHMTLSRWLRDYLYIPLGGNRRGTLRTYSNLSITMLLGGLWHGASWSFVVWGGLHGILLALHRRFGREADEDAPIAIGDLWRIVAMFHGAALLFVLFRADTLADGLLYTRSIFGGGEVDGWPIMQLLIVGGCIASHIVERMLRPRLAALQERCASSLIGVMLEGAMLGILLAAAILVSGAGGEFIYFQF